MLKCRQDLRVSISFLVHQSGQNILGDKEMQASGMQEPLGRIPSYVEYSNHSLR